MQMDPASHCEPFAVLITFKSENEWEFGEAHAFKSTQTKESRSVLGNKASFSWVFMCHMQLEKQRLARGGMR